MGKQNAMRTYTMDNETAGGKGRVEGEGTTNGGLTIEQMAGLQPLPNQEDSADIESNTLGGTADTGAGPAIGDGQPAE